MYYFSAFFFELLLGLKFQSVVSLEFRDVTKSQKTSGDLWSCEIRGIWEANLLFLQLPIYTLEAEV